MSKRDPICLDCSCETFRQSVRHQGRHMVTKDITFSCGARLKEFHDKERGLGGVEFVGCYSSS